MVGFLAGWLPGWLARTRFAWHRPAWPRELAWLGLAWPGLAWLGSHGDLALLGWEVEPGPGRLLSRTCPIEKSRSGPLSPLANIIVSWQAKKYGLVRVELP